MNTSQYFYSNAFRIAQFFGGWFFFMKLYLEMFLEERINERSNSRTAQ